MYRICNNKFVWRERSNDLYFLGVSSVIFLPSSRGVGMLLNRPKAKKVITFLGKHKFYSNLVECAVDNVC